MEFEWDEEKNSKNRRKHGVYFETAVQVFDDPYRIEIYDAHHSTIDEDRWLTIGMVFPNILYVVYTMRDTNNICRIISARKANAREKREYSQSKF